MKPTLTPRRGSRKSRTRGEAHGPCLFLLLHTQTTRMHLITATEKETAMIERIMQENAETKRTNPSLTLLL